MSNLTVIGEHDAGTIVQMGECMRHGNVVHGVLCADGHKGYSQPVGGVIAYEKQISISGVGFDIACGNMAVKLDVKYENIKERIPEIAKQIQRTISFGVGRHQAVHVEHNLFDMTDLWDRADANFLKDKARSQLGTVGAGNHYVDVFRDATDDHIWIGVHFGSRGLGHGLATKYLKAAGGKDGMDVPPTLVDEGTELFERYCAVLQLAGQYAYAGREWVIEQVTKIIGGHMMKYVHNHHNWAWLEDHERGLNLTGEPPIRPLWVVRKGATPAFPGQSGFVGGSMGDNAVIIRGALEPKTVKDKFGYTIKSRHMSLFSTVHGAGRICSRTEARGKFNRKTGERIIEGRFTRAEMDDWLKREEVYLIGGDLDESPMAYRRLSEVLKHHEGTIDIIHTLKPIIVVMAGSGVRDPYKD